MESVLTSAAGQWWYGAFVGPDMCCDEPTSLTIVSKRHSGLDTNRIGSVFFRFAPRKWLQAARRAKIPDDRVSSTRNISISRGLGFLVFCRCSPWSIETNGQDISTYSFSWCSLLPITAHLAPSVNFFHKDSSTSSSHSTPKPVAALPRRPFVCQDLLIHGDRFFEATPIPKFLPFHRLGHLGSFEMIVSCNIQATGRLGSYETILRLSISSGVLRQFRSKRQHERSFFETQQFPGVTTSGMLRVSGSSNLFEFELMALSWKIGRHFEILGE